MTFLFKLGSILLKGVSIASGLAPMVGPVVPQIVSKDLAQIAEFVVMMETIGQMKGVAGAEKARLTGPLVAQVLLQSPLLTDHKIANPTLFNQACVSLAGAVADVLNSLHADGVKEVSKV